jgi:hypothetical protein
MHCVEFVNSSRRKIMFIYTYLLAGGEAFRIFAIDR